MTMPTFVDAVVVHATSLNALATGINNLNSLLTGAVAPRLYVPTVTASINTPHLMATATDTIMTFDVSNINNDNMRAASVNHFTIQTAGIYIVWAQACFTANATGVRAAHILLNGTSVATNAVARASEGAPSGTDLATIALKTPPMSLAAAATLYLSTWQSSGGNLNLDTGLSGSFMAALRIGA